MSSRRRLRELLACGLVDSFGLSLGWTVFVLIAVGRGGMAEAAMYNAAMLIGIVLAAPATGWLAARLDGRRLLRLMALFESILRIATFGALLAGLPSTLIAAGVLVQYMAGWVTYAAMRAEVAAVDSRAQAMTSYGVAVAAIEAAGAGMAALLPVSLPLVTLVYGFSLLPTFLSARRARVSAAGSSSGQGRLPYFALFAGAGITFVATGPTLLAVALAVELHGTAWVAGSAAAFTVGCLCSSAAVDRVARLRLPPTIGWPLWGVGMLAGWVIAPWHGTALLAAQFLGGLCMTAFEGDMDARVAAGTDAGAVTRVLAWTASIRALGSALAVRMLPVMAVAPAIGAVAGGAVGVLAGGAVLTTVVALRLGTARRPSDAARLPHAARLIDIARRPQAARRLYTADLIDVARYPYPHAARLIRAARRPHTARLRYAGRLILAARRPNATATRLIQAARRPYTTRLRYSDRLVQAARLPNADRVLYADRLLYADRVLYADRFPRADRLVQAARFSTRPGPAHPRARGRGWVYSELRRAASCARSVRELRPNRSHAWPPGVTRPVS